MSVWNRNRLTSKLGIDYAIIQGPLGGLSSQRLTAAVSNFGGLGSFGAHGLSPAAIKDVIAEIRSLTSRPFAMSGSPWKTKVPEHPMKTRSTGASRPLRSRSRHWERLVRCTRLIRRLDLKTRLVCCWTRKCRHSASSMEFRQEKFWRSAERKASSRWARRRHPMRRWHFMMPASTPLSLPALKQEGIAAHSCGPRRIHLWARCRLVPQVVDVVDVPVIAAGGIGDARGMIAAMALGAAGVQMGKVFLACEESGATRLHREALRGRKTGHTVLTRGFTGRLARGIHNHLMEELNRNETEILPYPLQRGLVRNLAIPAAAAGRPDLLPLRARQSANLSTSTDVSAFLTSLLEEVSEIAGPVMDWSATRPKRHSRSE